MMLWRQVVDSKVLAPLQLSVRGTKLLTMVHVLLVEGLGVHEQIEAVQQCQHAWIHLWQHAALWGDFAVGEVCACIEVFEHLYG